MSTINLPQNIPAKAWVIFSIAIFILALCIGISFVRGMSTINTKAKKVERDVRIMEHRLINRSLNESNE